MCLYGKPTVSVALVRSGPNDFCTRIRHVLLKLQICGYSRVPDNQCSKDVTQT